MRNFRLSASTPACLTTPVINSWVNTPFPNQTNTFTARFEATPSEGAPLDVVMALSSGPKTAFGDFACLVRFQTVGVIDARNGANYEAASEIPFSANVTYSFRLVGNIPAQTYSVYVTEAGGTEQLVGQDFAFRPTAGTITYLNVLRRCATSACRHEWTGAGSGPEVARRTPSPKSQSNHV